MTFHFPYLILVTGALLYSQADDPFEQRNQRQPDWVDNMPSHQTDEKWGTVENQSTATNPPASTVSLAELRHPMSPKAQKMLEKAQKLADMGQHDAAIAQLKDALKESSATPYAHSLLGSEYLKTDRAEEALEELKLATVQLPIAINYSNLGLALLLAGDTDRAEVETRRALALDRKAPQTHYVLGIVLMDKDPHDPDALPELQIAARSLKTAHLALALYYVRNNNEDAADRELEAFTAADTTVKLSVAQRWLRLAAMERHPRVVLGFAAP